MGGDWHSQTRYMASFDDPNERCSLASYSPIDQITIFVNNSGIKPKEIDGEILQKSEWLDGTAFQTNPEEFPNKLFVNFPRERERSANYNVMATDYETYSLVWDCRDNGYYSIEYAWILTRDQYLKSSSPEIYSEIEKMAVEKFGFQERMIIILNNLLGNDHILHVSVY